MAENVVAAAAAAPPPGPPICEAGQLGGVRLVASPPPSPPTVPAPSAPCCGSASTRDTATRAMLEHAVRCAALFAALFAAAAMRMHQYAVALLRAVVLVVLVACAVWCSVLTCCWPLSGQAQQQVQDS
eukprot:365031-Chlamydomonas_euryale.AAC.1